jgi:CHAT domain-containing protein/Flp pilus assembly protein TadD
MDNYRIKRNVFISLLVILSTAFVPGLPIWSTSLVLAQSITQKATEASRLVNQGIQQFQTGQLQAALQSWEQALQIYRQIKDREGEGAALGNLGNAYIYLGDYRKAIDLYQQRLIIAKELGDRSGVAKALGNLGNAYNSLGDYRKAVDFHQQSLPIFKQLGDRLGEARTLDNLGVAYGALGQYQKAIEFHTLSLPIFKQAGDRAGEGRCLGNLGVAYNSLGNYQKAILFYQQALAIAEQIGNPVSAGKAMNYLGEAYNSLGEYRTAIDFHQKALAIFKQVGDRGSESDVLNNLGDVYFSLGEYRTAINFYQESLVIAKKIGDRPSESRAFTGLGNAYYSLGDYQQAISFQQQSLAIFKKIGSRSGEGIALDQLGLSYSALGDYQKAIDFHQQSLVITREIKDRRGESQSLGNLALAYSFLEDYPKAIDFHQQSLVITREIKDRRGEGITLNNLGFDHYRQRNFAVAETTLIEGIKVWESLRGKALKDSEKISIFETQSRTYRALQQVLIAQNKTDAALEISERGRARAFVELIASRISTNPNSQLLTPPAIAEIKQTAKSQKTTLIQYSIIYDEFKFQDKQGWKESELYIWVIKPTGEITFRKADLKALWQKENTTLDELVSTSRESIGARGTAFRGINVSYNPDAPKATNKLKRLHELLINPIADLLPKNPNARVTFIPQSSLFLVPFPALQDKDGKYLIEKHTILTSPSIQVLDLTRKQKQRIGNKPIQGNNMLIVGNPTMPDVSPKIGESPRQLTSLPGAEQEANAIANLFKTQSLIGNQATETEVTKRLSQAKFIHLATHGLFDDIQGLNSSIALAPGNKGNKKSDGLLTAGEILDLKLNAELVVLSACDTGRGRISGDGVIGLSRSLISAGVPSVLVSLWSVPDAPTSELMTEFYQNLQKSPDKAQALRQAMLTTIKQHPNPSAWAAFTLIGEAE